MSKKDALLESLDRLVKFTEQKELLFPFSDTILLDGDKAIAACTLGAAAEEVPISVSTPTLLPFTLFYNCVKNTPPERVIEEQDSQIILKHKRTRYGVRILQPEDMGESGDIRKQYPNPYKLLKEAYNANNKCGVPQVEALDVPTTLIQNASALASCTKEDPYKPLFACVNVTNSTIEACDNTKLLIYSGIEYEGEPFLCPAKALLRVPDSVEEMHVATDWIIFSGKGVYAIRRTHGEYPDLTELLNFKGSRALLPKTITQTIEHSQVFEQASALNLEIHFEKSRVTARVETPKGWFEETQKCKYKGKETAFVIPPALLKDLVSRSAILYIGDRIIKTKAKDSETGVTWQYATSIQTPDNEE
jgi:hypothetical protein